MRNRLRLLAATGLVAAGLVGGLGVATAANAADAGGDPTGNSVIKRNTTSFTSPSTTSTRVHSHFQGDKVQALCHREGQTRNGTFNWFLIKTGTTQAYVHQDYISAPTNLPHCQRG